MESETTDESCLETRCHTTPLEVGKQMRVSAWKWIWVIAFAIVPAGCHSPSGPDRELVPGIIFGFFADDPQVSLSREGPILTIEVTTYGDGCRSKGEIRTTVEIETRSITVAPFDWVGYGRICRDTLNEFDHFATVGLEAEGQWRVILIGDDIDGEPVQFEFTVVKG